jgi:hypothetical protein
VNNEELRMTEPALLKETPDFSLVLGGPSYQMFLRAHLSGPGLEQLNRRLLIIPVLTWVPLALLSTIEGHLFGGHNLPFLYDIESHVRFLVALPTLIVAEVVANRRTKGMVELFLKRRIVTSEDTPKFYAAIDAAMRMRNSVLLELTLLVFVYTIGHLIWRNGTALDGTTWYAVPVGKGLHLTVAGYWFSWISIPLFQFILLRWYMRLAIWYRLLWQVSKLNLRLLPTHADRAGGIGFLGTSSYAFSLILFAQGAVLAGMISSRIFYQGQNLMAFKMNILGLIGFFVLVILGPLTMFSPLLLRIKRTGLGEYGTLVTSYAIDFDEKWVHGGTCEEILGTGDIQSLADLGNSYSVVREMNLVPFGRGDVIQLVGATALPLLPLLLTIMPLDELVTRVIKVIF